MQSLRRGFVYATRSLAFNINTRTDSYIILIHNAIQLRDTDQIRMSTTMIHQCVLLLFLLSGSYCANDIGKYLKICDRSSADVNDCLAEAIQEGIVTMADGIEEFGVPPIDPYHQDVIKVEYKNNQIFVKMTLRDIYVQGNKDSKVHDVRLRADEDNFHLEVDLTTPRVFVKGLYSAEGRYNSLSIKAHGAFNTTMTKLVYTWKLDGKPEKRDGETYMRITNFYMRPDLEDLKSHLSNENPETKGLTDLGNDFANQNWRVLYRELLPYAQDNWKRIGTRVANKLFLKVPYSQLFPANS